MIDRRKLIKMRALRRKDETEHQAERVHFIKMSPAKVSSNKILTYPFRLKNATLIRLRSFAVTSRCSQYRIPATVAIPANASQPRFANAAVATSRATVAA